MPSDHDYEEIQTSYQIKSPQRPAPRPPNTANCATNTSGHSVGTLGAYSEVEGVPFIINPMLKRMTDSEVSIKLRLNLIYTLLNFFKNSKIFYYNFIFAKK